MRRKLVTLAMILVAIPGLAYLGLIVVFSGPPDTFDDMNAKIDSISFPAEFELISIRQGGSRSRFAASPRPYVERDFSLGWQRGATCDQLFDLAGGLGLPERSDARGRCNIYVEIPSGKWAQLVNVHSYTLSLQATPPDMVTTRSEERCAASRARSMAQGNGLHFRDAPCWVEPGHAFVRVTLTGKAGW